MAQYTIIYFGDSITEGWIDAELRTGESFPAVTDSLIAAQGTDILSYNAGIGGNTTRDGVLRMNTDVLAFSPDIVVIEFGSNDCFIYDPGYGSQVPPDQFRKNLETMIRACRGVNAIPVLVGMPPIIPERYYPYSNSAYYEPYGGVGALNNLYDSVIRKIAEEQHIAYVQIDFGGQEGNEEHLGFDGVHPLPSGHRIIAQTLAPVLLHEIEGVDSNADAMELALYPSPISFQSGENLAIRFSIQQPQNINIDIVNEAGAIVQSIRYTAQNSGTQCYFWDGISTEGTYLPKGAYFIHLTTATGATVKKIIVQ